MSIGRFSLATLMGVVFVTALGLAAMRYASQLWAATVLSLTFVVLLITILGALFERGRPRVFWGGFAVFGWAYMTLSLGPWFSDHMAPFLLSTKLLSVVQEQLSPFPFRVGDKILVQWGGSWWGSTLTVISGERYLIHYDGYSNPSDEWVQASRIKQGEPEHFMRIGHALFGLLFGLAGGNLAGWIFGSRATQEQTTSEELQPASATIRKGEAFQRPGGPQ